MEDEEYIQPEETDLKTTMITWLREKPLWISIPAGIVFLFLYFVIEFLKIAKDMKA